MGPNKGGYRSLGPPCQFATLGTTAVTAKFIPFYKKYLPADKIDLPFITLVIYLGGLLITMLIMLVLQEPIIKIFGKNNPLFQPYYFALLLFVCFQSVFVFMEMHAWFAGKNYPLQPSQGTFVSRL
jgi:hypothetical protein